MFNSNFQLSFILVSLSEMLKFIYFICSVSLQEPVALEAVSIIIAYAYFEDTVMVWRLHLNLSDYLITQGNNLCSNLIAGAKLKGGYKGGDSPSQLPISQGTEEVCRAKMWFRYRYSYFDYKLYKILTDSFSIRLPGRTAFPFFFPTFHQ